ncbi:MAG: alpha/beta fold hydrolase [Candidatus Dormibacteria bacterium]
MNMRGAAIDSVSGRLRIPDEVGAGHGMELEFWEQGAGRTVIFLHGGILTNWFGPLADHLAKLGEYRVVSYNRPGYAGSSLPSEPLTMAGQAECCLALMRHMGIKGAHLVGHSIGACVALQVALQQPGVVLSLGLLEPPVFAATPNPGPALSVIGATAAAWNQGDIAGAMDVFMRGVVDPDYGRELDRTLGTWREDALRGTDVFLRVDQAAMQGWRFGQTEAAMVCQPSILFLGGESNRINAIREPIHNSLLSWLPDAVGATIPGGSHLLPLQEPTRIADVLDSFYTQRFGHWMPRCGQPHGAQGHRGTSCPSYTRMSTRA